MNQWGSKTSPSAAKLKEASCQMPYSSLNLLKRSSFLLPIRLKRRQSHLWKASQNRYEFFVWMLNQAPVKIQLHPGFIQGARSLVRLQTSALVKVDLLKVWRTLLSSVRMLVACIKRRRGTNTVSKAHRAAWVKPRIQFVWVSHLQRKAFLSWGLHRGDLASIRFIVIR